MTVAQARRLADVLIAAQGLTKRRPKATVAEALARAAEIEAQHLRPAA